VVAVGPDAPEPAVIRWDDLEEMTVRFAHDEDDGYYLSRCELRGRTGHRVQVRKAHGPGNLRTIEAEAGQVLTARLLPGLLERYKSGAPVTFGAVTLDKTAIAGIPWSQVTRIHAEDPGRYITIKHGKRSTTNINQARIPNGPVLLA
jgi:hypothetical protein